jgi:hypothetical protein
MSKFKCWLVLQNGFCRYLLAQRGLAARIHPQGNSVNIFYSLSSPQKVVLPTRVRR